MNRYIKTFENYSESKLNIFLNFLNDHDFELYDGEDDLRTFFIRTSNNLNFSNEKKAEKISNFLEDKWGLYDGYSEVYDFLINLFQTN